MSVKKLIFFSIIVVLGFIINNLSQSIYSTWQKKDLVAKSKAQLEREKKENEELKKLTNVSRPEFVEEEARNKLFMVKSGEEIVVIPSGALEKGSRFKPTPQDTRPNWKKWWELFF